MALQHVSASGVKQPAVEFVTNKLLRFLAAAEMLPGDAPGPPPVSPSIPRLPAAAGARGSR